MRLVPDSQRLAGCGPEEKLLWGGLASLSGHSLSGLLGGGTAGLIDSNTTLWTHLAHFNTVAGVLQFWEVEKLPQAGQFCLP